MAQTVKPWSDLPELATTPADDDEVLVFDQDEGTEADQIKRNRKDKLIPPRTRRVLLPPIPYGGTAGGIQAQGYLTDIASAYNVRGYFVVPDDFKEDFQVSVILMPYSSGEGDVYAAFTLRSGGLGEDWETYNYAPGYAAITVPAGDDQPSKHIDYTMTIDPSPGDVVWLGFTRNGTSGSDTAGTVYIVGFLITYTADM
ncbi:MAG: hypothetical protein SVT56_04905 [Chloroflexota bacterium]|nr:hypothetical protein [Chloroflexota bacterium]